MKFSRIFLVLVIFMSLFAIAGCSASIDEEITQTKQQVDEAFNSKPIKPNKKAELFSYYLPSNFELKKVVNNNVILHQGKQPFILFVNPKEDANSQLMYKALGNTSNKDTIKSTFEGNGRFGYVSVKKVKENLYEISVGIGGVKMTTEAKVNSVAKNAKEMMNIVSSVKIN